jgi:hypothetical protein
MNNQHKNLNSLNLYLLTIFVSFTSLLILILNLSFDKNSKIIEIGRTKHFICVESNNSTIECLDPSGENILISIKNSEKLKFTFSTVCFVKDKTNLICYDKNFETDKPFLYIKQKEIIKDFQISLSSFCLKEEFKGYKCQTINDSANLKKIISNFNKEEKIDTVFLEENGLCYIKNDLLKCLNASTSNTGDFFSTHLTNDTNYLVNSSFFCKYTDFILSCDFMFAKNEKFQVDFSEKINLIKLSTTKGCVLLSERIINCWGDNTNYLTNDEFTKENNFLNKSTKTYRYKFKYKNIDNFFISDSYFCVIYNSNKNYKCFGYQTID